MRMINEVQKVLQAGWKIDLDVRMERIGVNNTTWQVGEVAWLARYDKDETNRVIRELDLYEYLSTKQLSDSDMMFFYPEVIRTTKGHRLYDDGTYLWKLSKNMIGVMPSQENAELYPILANGLGHFHRKLREVPLDFAVTSTKLVQTVGAYVSMIGDISWDICGDSAIKAIEEENILFIKNAALQLSTNFNKVRELPIQLIHGDFTHPNLRIKEDHTKLIGVLDLEFCSADPALLDLATVVLTLLTRSRLSEPAKLLSEIIKAYEGGGGYVDPATLEVAVLARKFDSYWYHRNRFLEGKGTLETYQRQLEQLKLVMETFG
ncbi:Phosphotransferase enzyme family [Chlamydia abortus]|uniref:phosphotransferase n=1 Tax=Paenibacillus sp. SAFN-117 TaxID=3436860 RepID=UPI000A27E2E5|nr:Phosphotransferase enzyme family [Chlamydia abortus]